MDPCSLPLGSVVTASASFPPLIGPITMRIGEEDTFWHVGDGGLYENSGIESLLFLYLKQLQQRRAKRALIIAFDSSFPFSVGERRLSLRSLPFSLWSFDFSRVPCIMEERVTSYQALFFRSLQFEGCVSRLEDHQRHFSPPHRRQVGDGSERSAAGLQGGGGAAADPQAVRERIAEIPTRLGLPSECDRQLLARAAANLVAEHRGEMLEFLNRPE